MVTSRINMQFLHSSQFNKLSTLESVEGEYCNLLVFCRQRLRPSALAPASEIPGVSSMGREAVVMEPVRPRCMASSNASTGRIVATRSRYFYGFEFSHTANPQRR